MTVTATPSKVIYKGNGKTVAFPIPFYFSDNSHIRVVLTENDRDTELVTGFSITGNTLTMSVPPLSGQKLTIYRWLPITQGVQLTNQGAYSPGVVEGALDEGAMIDQQLQEQLDRAILLPPSYEGDANDSNLALVLLDARDRAEGAADRAEGAAETATGAIAAAEAARDQAIAGIAVDKHAAEEAALRAAIDASTANIASVSAKASATTASASATAAVSARDQAAHSATTATDASNRAVSAAAGVAELADFLKVLDYGEIADLSPWPKAGVLFDFGAINHV